MDDPGAQEAFDTGGMPGVKEYVNKKLNEWKTTPVKIAVAGSSGAGKSSFINTIRHVEKGDENYAEVGVKETTLERKCYEFPNNPLIQLWDLAGAGTERFNADAYAKDMEFDTYDAFVILSHARFTQIDKMISDEAKKISKPFFFTRTKMDEVLRSEKRENRKSRTEFDPEATAKVIRDDCQETLGDSVDIFFIANLIQADLEDEIRDTKIVSFLSEGNDRLRKEILEKLPDIQKTALLFSLKCDSVKMVERKMEEISSRFKWKVLLSVGFGAIPVPGLSLAVDIPMLLEEDYFQKQQLGIDDASIRTKAMSCNIDKATFLRMVVGNAEFYREFHKKLFDLMTQDGVAKHSMKALLSSSMVASEVSETAAKFIPIAGWIASGAISGAATYGVLSSMLHFHSKVAKSCFAALHEFAEEEMS